MEPFAGLVLIVLVGALVVAACQSGAPGSRDLAGPVWQWTATQETNPPTQPVTPDPQKYTIRFLADGTVNVKADCNNLSGNTVGVPLDLTLTLSASTLVACTAPSLDVIYIEYLRRVATYSTTNGKLNLDLADGGAMQFSAAGS